jgi:hypothetical protein
VRTEERLIGIPCDQISEEEDLDSALERFYIKGIVSKSLVEPCGIPVRSMKAPLVWLTLINVGDPTCEQKIAT